LGKVEQYGLRHNAALARSQFRFFSRGEVKLSSFAELSPVPQEMAEAKRCVCSPEPVVSVAGELESEVKISAGARYVPGIPVRNSRLLFGRCETVRHFVLPRRLLGSVRALDERRYAVRLEEVGSCVFCPIDKLSRSLEIRSVRAEALTE